MQPATAVDPTAPTLAEGLASAATGDLALTLEALLPQFRALCRVFYARHSADAQPIAARRWLHRELISRFGPQAVFDAGPAIAKRLKTAQRGVSAALAAEEAE